MPRKKPPGQLLPSAHQVAREYRVMTALRDSGVPVPPTHLMCMDEAIVGTPFFVMGCVDGRVFRQPHLPGVSAADRGAMYDDMVDVLARLHRVDMEAAGLGDYGKPGGMPDESTYVEAYCRRTGRTGIPDWHFYLAFSMFRLTSILQRVYARGLQGNAASAHALERGAAARAIAERGWALAAS